MKHYKISIAGALAALLAMSAPVVTLGQDSATPQEVIAKVKEASASLAKTGDLKQFDQKEGPWVWKDSYVFVHDCAKKVLAAHPMRPELIGQPMSAVKDAKGHPLYADPGAVCTAAMKPSGVWTQYWWTKPGQDAPARKLSYHLGVPGTNYVVAAGVYGDKATVAELTKLTTTK
jgi:hypothetical protein